MEDEARLRLCYLGADKVKGPAGDLQGMALQTEENDPIGVLDGVVIDAARRRLRYFVVERRGFFRRRRYLVPADRPVQVDDDRRALRLHIDAGELASCDEFDAAAIPPFADEDVIAAMFGRGHSDSGDAAA